MRFCKAAGKKPIPTSECTLTLFMTHLATHKISFATIKVYLSAVHHMHLCRGLHDHFNQQFTPRLQLALKRGKHAFYLLQEKDGELKGRTRAMTSLQVILSVVPYKGVMSCY